MKKSTILQILATFVAVLIVAIPVAAFFEQISYMWTLAIGPLVVLVFYLLAKSAKALRLELCDFLEDWATKLKCCNEDCSKR